MPLALHFEDGKLMSRRLTTEGSLLQPLPGPRPPPPTQPSGGVPSVIVGQWRCRAVCDARFAPRGFRREFVGNIGSDHQIVCVKNDTAFADSHCGLVRQVDSRNRVWITDVNQHTMQRALLVKIADR